MLLINPYEILFNFSDKANINCITIIILNGKIQALDENIKAMLLNIKYLNFSSGGPPKRGHILLTFSTPDPFSCLNFREKK